MYKFIYATTETEFDPKKEIYYHGNNITLLEAFQDDVLRMNRIDCYIIDDKGQLNFHV